MELLPTTEPSTFLQEIFSNVQARFKGVTGGSCSELGPFGKRSAVPGPQSIKNTVYSRNQKQSNEIEA